MHHRNQPFAKLVHLSEIYLTGLETPTWSVKWNHSLAIVSNWTKKQ